MISSSLPSKGLLVQSLSLLFLLTSYTTNATFSNSNHVPRRSLNHSSKRQDGPSANILDPNSYMASNFQNGSTPPGARQGDTDGQYVVMGTNQNGTDAASQLPHCNTIFIGTADVTGESRSRRKRYSGGGIHHDLVQDFEIDY